MPVVRRSRTPSPVERSRSHPPAPSHAHPSPLPPFNAQSIPGGFHEHCSAHCSPRFFAQAGDRRDAVRDHRARPRCRLPRLRPGPGRLHRHHRTAHLGPDPARRSGAGNQGAGRLHRLRRRADFSLRAAQLRSRSVLRRPRHLRRRRPGDRRRDHGRGGLTPASTPGKPACAPTPTFPVVWTTSGRSASGTSMSRRRSFSCSSSATCPARGCPSPSAWRRASSSRAGSRG
ncbi:hypothetical protein ebA6597 [Aromatoleum aromaticum EbN1]|uniref:Uncharacterized protein n=1 Tax=Aromatoleum aromaticum (strain DSM 19018 / LMG 30748 / EbN1) TaxID=76114 RepID=Q5NYG6_AROAE|nr:hypothetical protein ebA6597 [Aromatoleum aromaticum EbN1]